MERDGPSLHLRQRCGRARGKDIEEGLVRVRENNLVVLPRMYGSECDSLLKRGNLRVARERPWMQLEMVVEGDGFLACFADESYFDLNFELSPSA